MAKEPMQRDPGEETDDKAGADAKPRKSRIAGLMDRYVSKGLLAVLLAVSILGHGVGMALYACHARRGSAEIPKAEVTVGPFCFSSEQDEGGPIVGAKFSLHLALLDEVDETARILILRHKHRVQEAIEELMRKAHGGDFRDPGLVDLKRQLQEQVNQALGIRAVAEVIITDLELQWSEQVLGTPTETVSLGDREKPQG